MYVYANICICVCEWRFPKCVKETQNSFLVILS